MILFVNCLSAIIPSVSWLAALLDGYLSMPET